MPNPPSLNVIYDLAVKQFEFVDRAYDALSSRAAAMVGWTSFVCTAAIYVHPRVPGPEWLHQGFVLIVGALALVALCNALLACRTTDMERWPDPTLVFGKYAEKEEDVTRLQMLWNIRDSTGANVKAVTRKGKRIKRAIGFLSAVSLLLVLALFSSFLLPREAGRTDNLSMTTTSKSVSGSSGGKQPASPASTPAVPPQTADKSVTASPIAKVSLDESVTTLKANVGKAPKK